MIKKVLLVCISIVTAFSATSCNKVDMKKSQIATEKSIKNPDIKDENQGKEYDVINKKGKTIEERFNVPKGFERISIKKNSFGDYLRKLPLKTHGSKVLYYDGREKIRDNVYIGVVDMDIGDRDLQQCADAVMRLRGEYLYKNKEYDKIHFNFVSGFNCSYSKWMDGYRVGIKNDKAYWKKKYNPSNNYESFRKYMNVVFAYASTLSLEKELIPISKDSMKIGDVYIKGGSPGHAVIVVDMAKNKKTGEKVFMIAQSYMPAQDIQILCNNDNSLFSPWYNLNFEDKLYTPEWTFDEDMLRRFKEN
ncbi:DUF4846 domain-containing protein [Clostridium aestuarii]|uniref:DUF4846 domain-containing protein n=1 Tax=Clostridium aestuarii TaxID=338193 RepID=A0ABT4CV89_9CLOT|nr:DUF4846 domain-containing protein [Clostridium aestuarii]MCY6482899.1 DUF4846 domain-containing protein [Clostridium aestuarii]